MTNQNLYILYFIDKHLDFLYLDWLKQKFQETFLNQSFGEM